MGRLILSLDRWNHCTPSSQSHSWLQSYLPLQFPGWQCLSWLRELEHPGREMVQAAPSTRRVTGWGRGPPVSLGCPQLQGARLGEGPANKQKTPEYFRKVFFFPLHPYFQSSSHLSG